MISSTGILLVVLGIALFLVLVLIAMRVGSGRRPEEDEQEQKPVQMGSGIYSIVRKSPRESLLSLRPSAEAISQYLSGQNVDSQGAKLGPADKQLLQNAFRADIESSIACIEQGDRDSVEYYFYEFTRQDPVCAGAIAKGHYVSREDLLANPSLVPPFHLGCACRIKAQTGTDNARKTIAMAAQPLVRGDAPPRLPDWRSILRIPQE